MNKSHNINYTFALEGFNCRAFILRKLSYFESHAKVFQLKKNKLVGSLLHLHKTATNAHLTDKCQ